VHNNGTALFEILLKNVEITFTRLYKYVAIESAK